MQGGDLERVLFRRLVSDLVVAQSGSPQPAQQSGRQSTPQREPRSTPQLEPRSTPQLEPEPEPPPQPAGLLPDPAPRPIRVPIISVDDHLIEPPDLFVGRMPAHLAERAPKIVELENGQQAWEYEGRLYPNVGLNAVVGRPARTGAWTLPVSARCAPAVTTSTARVADMDLNGVWASLCFPSLVAGFCGAVFSRSTDKELGLACVRAWNDWHADVWAGTYPERIIALQLPWLADIELATDEVLRNSERGFRAAQLSRISRATRASFDLLGKVGPVPRSLRRHRDCRVSTHRSLFVGAASFSRSAVRAPADTLPGERFSRRGRVALVGRRSAVSESLCRHV